MPPGFRDDLPIPTVGADDVLVRVQASSVNPADAAIASGMLKGMAEYEFPGAIGEPQIAAAQRQSIVTTSIGSEMPFSVDAPRPDVG